MKNHLSALLIAALLAGCRYLAYDTPNYHPGQIGNQPRCEEGKYWLPSLNNCIPIGTDACTDDPCDAQNTGATCTSFEQLTDNRAYKCTCWQSGAAFDYATRRCLPGGPGTAVECVTPKVTCDTERGQRCFEGQDGFQNCGCPADSRNVLGYCIQNGKKSCDETDPAKAPCGSLTCVPEINRGYLCICGNGDTRERPEACKPKTCADLACSQDCTEGDASTGASCRCFDGHEPTVDGGCNPINECDGAPVCHDSQVLCLDMTPDALSSTKYLCVCDPRTTGDDCEFTVQDPAWPMPDTSCPLRDTMVVANGTDCAVAQDATTSSTTRRRALYAVAPADAAAFGDTVHPVSSDDGVPLRVVADRVTQLYWTRAPLARGGAHRLSHADAVRACDEATTGAYPDWRLPTRLELLSLADLHRVTANGKRLHPIFELEAAGSAPQEFWSDTPVAGADGRHWVVSFENGLWFEAPDVGAGDDKAFVRCVRVEPWRREGDVPWDFRNERWRVKAGTDGQWASFVDVKTRLEWTVRPVGNAVYVNPGETTPTTGEPRLAGTWSGASTACSELELTSGEVTKTDWGLPSIKELLTLLDSSRTASPLPDPDKDNTERYGVFDDDDITTAIWSGSPHPTEAGRYLTLTPESGAVDQRRVDTNQQTVCVRWAKELVQR